MNTAERLKIIRGKLTQAEFATALDIHKNTLGRYERGENLPDSELCAKICSIFGVSPAWLLLGEGDMKVSEQAKKSQESEQVCFSAISTDWPFPKIVEELDLEKKERRELAAENRSLYKEKEKLLREKEELLRENGTLREKLARLEGGLRDRGNDKKEADDTEASRFDKKLPLSSSSRRTPLHK